MTTDSLFEKRYRKYGPELQNFIARYVGNYSTAEDLAHEVFIHFYKATQGKSIEKPKAYLFAAARNHLINHFRRRANQRLGSTVEFDECVHAGKDPTEDEQHDAREGLQLVIKAIRTLPPRAQQAFILSRIYRFSYKEVGKRMQISARTVENHVAKGLLVCAKYMAENHPEFNRRVEDNIVDLAAHRGRSKRQATDG